MSSTSEESSLNGSGAGIRSGRLTAGNSSGWADTMAHAASPSFIRQKKWKKEEEMVHCAAKLRLHIANMNGISLACIHL